MRPGADTARASNDATIARIGNKEKKTRCDTAEIARSVVEQAIGEPLTPREDEEPEEELAPTRPGPSAGGRPRPKKLGQKRAGEIVKKAAQGRWKRPKLLSLRWV